MQGALSRLAALAALLSLPSAQALAAGLGGDCCADLGSRVAGLEATTARKGNKRVSLTVSGRVHANLMWWDDHAAVLDADEATDKSHDLYFGNSASGGPLNSGGSETHIVFSGNGRISGDLSAGFLLTLKDDFTGTASQTGAQTGTAVTGDTTYVYARSAKWGEYRLGFQPSASDDAYYVDFGGPGTVGGLSGARFTGGFRLRGAGADAGELTDVTYAHVLGELADSNDNRLVYISPSWNGFTYKSDIGADTGSVGLYWVGGAGSLRGAFGAGYQVSRKGTGQSPGGAQAVQSASAATAGLTDATHDVLRQLVLSASIMETKSGLFLTGEYSRAYADIAGRQDATNGFARAGWTKNVTGLGATTLDVQYERTGNKLANHTSAHLWGAGIDQAIDAVASNIYVHYQHDSFDTDGVVSNAATAFPGTPSLTTPAETCLANGGGNTCAVNAQSIDSVTAGMVVNF